MFNLVLLMICVWGGGVDLAQANGAAADLSVQSSSRRMFPTPLWADARHAVLDVATPAIDCRQRLQNLMCLVDPMKSGKDWQKVSSSTCLDGGDQYARHFLQLHEHFPPALQQIFCSLKVIYIEKEIAGTAYAGLMNDESGKVVGAGMGIRKSVLDENLELVQWGGWKEQLSFGGVSDSYTLTPGFPWIETEPTDQVNNFLYFLVAHEFGHLLDFSNKVNKEENCMPLKQGQMGPECEMAEGSSGAISWITNQVARPEDDFESHSEFCFYWCEQGHVDSSFAPQIYRELFNSRFISAYASRQPSDDFADSLAYYLLHQNLKSSYTVHVEQGYSFDIMQKLTSPGWSVKFDYLKRFLSRADLKYPGSELMTHWLKELQQWIT